MKHKLKIPTKKELKLKVPDHSQLEEMYFKGKRIQRDIELLQESIDRREAKIKELNKTETMKQYRTHELMIKTTYNHIKAKYKLFKQIFK